MVATPSPHNTTQLHTHTVVIVQELTKYEECEMTFFTKAVRWIESFTLVAAKIIGTGICDQQGIT